MVRVLVLFIFLIKQDSDNKSVILGTPDHSDTIKSPDEVSPLPDWHGYLIHRQKCRDQYKLLMCHVHANCLFFSIKLEGDAEEITHF
jgi:hypothetical protein